MMSAGTVKFVCVRRSNGRHLCKTMETLRMQRKWKTRKHKTLDVDWLINCRSGKTTQQRPWDEDNGSAVICVTALRFGRHGSKKAAQIFSIRDIYSAVKDGIWSVASTSEEYIIGVELSKFNNEINIHCTKCGVSAWEGNVLTMWIQDLFHLGIVVHFRGTVPHKLIQPPYLSCTGKMYKPSAVCHERIKQEQFKLHNTIKILQI